MDTESQGQENGTASTQTESSTADQVQSILNSSQEAAPAIEDQGQVASEPEVGTDTQLSDFAQGILKDIPEGDRSVVAKYLNQWDAGVTRRFQQVQSTWSPLQKHLDAGVEMSDFESAIQLYQLLDEDPQAAMNILADATGITLGSGPQQETVSEGGQIAQLPPEIQRQLQQQGQFQEQFATWWQEQQSKEAAAKQDAELESYLGLLKREKGDFDESFVLTRMAAGIAGDVAVDEWNSMISSYVKEQGLVKAPTAPPAPNVLSGGAPPTGQKPITQATEQDRKSLVAQMLNQANAQGT